MAEQMAQDDRPDWVRCIAHTHADLAGQAWCGRDVAGGWAFVDAAHAAENGRKGGRLVACPACAESVAAALANGHPGR